MASSNALNDLRNFDSEDFKRIGTAPAFIRVLLMLLVGALIIAGIT